MIRTSYSKELDEILDNVKLIVEHCRYKRMHTLKLCIDNIMVKTTKIQKDSLRLSILYLIGWCVVSLLHAFFYRNLYTYLFATTVFLYVSALNRKVIVYCNMLANECRILLLHNLNNLVRSMEVK